MATIVLQGKTFQINMVFLILEADIFMFLHLFLVTPLHNVSAGEKFTLQIYKIKL